MNLFELFVKIGVDDQASSKLGSLTNKLGNGLKTAAKIGTAAVTAAAAGITALTTAAVKNYAEYEQLAGGMEKIFSGMDTSKIANDAAQAYKELGMSANEYLSTINDVGAGFAATMGAEAGYDAAKKGLTAISDYASGTGKNLNELSQKFTMITRSTSSYQSIADQFSGILPATSAGFLEQAQAAGFLSAQYKTLTEVPINEYQQAVTNMLEQGVEALNLTGNTANEASTTISGALAMTKAAWSNWVTSLSDDNANVQQTTQQLVDSVIITANNILPAVQTILTTLISSLQTELPTIINTIIEFLTSNLPQITAAGVQLLLALVTGIVNAIPDLIAAIPELVAAIVDTLAASWPQIQEAGRGAFNALWQGIQGVWNNIVGWFQGVWNSLFGNLRVNVSGGGSGGIGGGVSVHGSHAAGLSYVPFDNYIAKLHQGERVLTAAENKVYTQGQAQSIPQEIRVVAPISVQIDGKTIAYETYDTYKQIERDRGGAFVRARA